MLGLAIIRPFGYGFYLLLRVVVFFLSGKDISNNNEFNGGNKVGKAAGSFLLILLIYGVIGLLFAKLQGSRDMLYAGILMG